MIKFFKNIKNKLYYQYFDKIVNSPENLPPIELDQSKNTLVIDLPVQSEEKVITEPNDKPVVKKKPGRPKSVSPTPKKAATKKVAPKPKPKQN